MKRRVLEKFKAVSKVFTLLLLPLQLFYAFLHQHFLQVQHIQGQGHLESWLISATSVCIVSFYTLSLCRKKNDGDDQRCDFSDTREMH